MKKSQVGIEFLYFVGIAIIILMVYLGLSSTYLSFTTDRKNTLTAQSLLEQIRNEINLAGRVEDGYSRTIKLPNQLNNKPYKILVEGREISIEFPIGQNTYARILSTDVTVTTPLQPGNTHTITKNNNIVTICAEGSPECSLGGGSQMGTESKNGGTFVDDGGVGTFIWGIPSNAQFSDNVFSTAIGLTDNPDITHYLKVTDFGFNIPTGATINGIKVEIEVKGQGDEPPASWVHDYSIKIVKGGTVQGANRATADGDTPVIDNIYKAYGGLTDLWDLSLTYSDVNADNFGVVASYQVISDGSDINIDHIKMTVYYTTT